MSTDKRTDRRAIRGAWKQACEDYPPPSPYDMLRYACDVMGFFGPRSDTFIEKYLDTYDEAASWGHTPKVLARMVQEMIHLEMTVRAPQPAIVRDPEDRLRELWVEHFGSGDDPNQFDQSYSDLLDGDKPDGRFLLIEENDRGGHYFTVFATLPEVGEYHTNQEYAEDWEIDKVIDLHTGKTYMPHFHVTFTEET
jgi:hypothetical protein